MKSKIVALLAAIPLLLVMSSVAQTPDSDASNIIRRSSLAMGCNTVGRDTPISAEGTLTVSSLAAPMRVKIDTQGNDRMRSELDTVKEKKVTIINAGRGQIHHGDGGITALAEHNSSHQKPMHIPCLTNLALPPGQVDATFLRTEAIGADTFDVVDLELTNRPKEKQAADRMKTTVWISRATGYLTKLQYVNAAEQDSNDTQLVQVEYTDYRVIDGLAVPFHQVTHAGKAILDLQFDSVQLNTAAADFNLR
jgi:hypothetical protein